MRIESLKNYNNVISYASNEVGWLIGDHFSEAVTY